jgi:hypothetical protein
VRGNERLRFAPEVTFMSFRVVAVMSGVLLAAGCGGSATAPTPATSPARQTIPDDVVESVTGGLVEKYGQDQAERARVGVRQVAERWWPDKDGDAAAFSTFCADNFLVDPAALEAAFERIQTVVEQIDGHLHEVRRELTAPTELDTGPIGPVDRLLANVDLQAHVDDDLFGSKVAFLALLNFPVHTLSDRLQSGESWDRETWAKSRMMDRFATRVPAEVAQQATLALTAAGNYIDEYNIRMDRLITPQGERLFPENLRLISHWGLRDELASHYDGTPEGLAKQRMIQKVMERIVRQEIPAVAIDNADVLWCPETNEVRPYAESGSAAAKAPSAEREPDTRFQRLLDVYHAVRQVDPYSPTAPTYIARRFDEGRQIPEAQVEALLVSVLASEEVRDLAQVIAGRLGRPLEPFDIWYSGFKSRGAYSEAELDKIVRAKYPTREAFQADLPRILRDLGFAPQTADWLADHVEVDPSRGAGHALGAVRREDDAHLRTRIAEGGMDYKGYNIAVHEFGHNVEQVFSLNGIDYWWLTGVPNTAFTEALAFVFQGRDLELLGLASPGEDARRIEALGSLWATFEIGGVGLVDMRVWNWMYEHPDATAAELREATLAAARDVWNQYYAPLFGVKDVEILAIYSHMIAYALYLPDYPIGHIIAFQVAGKLGQGDFGKGFEAMARQGRLTPDAWMRGAVGAPLSAEALLTEARQALDALP